MIFSPTYLNGSTLWPNPIAVYSLSLTETRTPCPHIVHTHAEPGSLACEVIHSRIPLQMQSLQLLVVTAPKQLEGT